MKKLDPCSV